MIEKKHWQCDCGTAHFLTFWWDDDDLAAGAEFAGCFTVHGDFRTSWYRRAQQAYRLLRNGHEDSRVEVVLYPETADEIARELASFAHEMRKGLMKKEAGKLQ